MVCVTLEAEGHGGRSSFPATVCLGCLPSRKTVTFNELTLAVLGFEPMASSMKGRHSTMEPYPQSPF